jgi:class 3 adenylate cyclase
MHPFPTGTVTLLFSDIEGSTHLLRQLGEGYSDLLIHCRQVLRTSFQQYRGQEVDTQGDSFCVVFARNRCRLGGGRSPACSCRAGVVQGSCGARAHGTAHW